MATNLLFSDFSPAGTAISVGGADGFSKASILPTFTGGSTPPLNTNTIVRFATSFAPSGAGTVADLFLVGGLHNPRQWSMVNYTATGTVLSAANPLTFCDFSPVGSSGELVGTILNSAAGGLQGTYGGAPWIRFATSYAPANGLNVMDLVMTGGRNDQDRWSVVVYTVTAGVLS
jgi:hypothetical protein